MIIYNGVPLDSVANVQIEDIVVSPINYRPVAHQRAIRFGADFVRMGGGERTVAVTFALLDDDKITRHEALMNISEWARTDAEYRIDLPNDPARYLVGVCTAKPEPSTRQWWESKLRLVFTCYDNPFWTAKEEKSVACGTAFRVYGDAPPLMQIKRTLSEAASSQSYSDGTDTMTFSTVPAGDLVIDLNRQTAAVSGSSIMQYYAPAGTFLIPQTGLQTITGAGTIQYRERWQ